MRALRAQALRFVLVGGINTVVTYAIFIGLGLIMPAGLAYTIAFFLGLVWVVFGSSRYVFKAGLDVKRLAVFAAWYLFIYAVGQLVVQLIAPVGFISLALTSLVVLLVTTPLTFFGGRLVFKPLDPAKSNDRTPRRGK